MIGPTTQWGWWVSFNCGGETRYDWEMLSDPLTFFGLLVSHWAAFMTGGIPAAAFLLLERLRAKQFEWRTFFFVFIVCGFFAASYQTWYGERDLRIAAESKLQQAKPDLGVIDSIAGLIDEADTIQNAFLQTDNADQITGQYNDWFSRTNKFLIEKLGTSYGTTFRSAPSALSVPMNHSVVGGGVWAAIEGKKIALNVIISDLRRPK